MIECLSSPEFKPPHCQRKKEKENVRKLSERPWTHMETEE
jgi:hypothetical protein